MQTCQIGEGSELLFDWSAKCQLLLLIQFAHFCYFFASLILQIIGQMYAQQQEEQ